MNLLSLLLGSMTSGKSVKEVSAKTGLSERQVKKLLKLAIPLILRFLTKNASSAAGAVNLLGALNQHTDQKEMDQQLKEADEIDGQKIIQHIFGARKQETTQELSAQSGLKPEQVSQILAIIAPALMSGVSEAAANTTAAQESQAPTISLGSASGIFSALTGSKPAQKEENSASNGMDLLQALLNARS